jgi:hypothetical protein
MVGGPTRSPKLSRHVSFSPGQSTILLPGCDLVRHGEEDGSVLRLTHAARSEQEVETLDTMVEEIAEFARCIPGEGVPETGVAEAIEVAPFSRRLASASSRDPRWAWRISATRPRGPLPGHSTSRDKH